MMTDSSGRAWPAAYRPIARATATGDDYLNGGADADLLIGGSGSDTLDGGADEVADKLRGGAGADTFIKCYLWVEDGTGQLVLKHFPDTWLDFSPAQGDVARGGLL
jgi:RTX calcium-binding nonapeptide repeat (4 copies)